MPNERMTYLDYAASAPLVPEALEAMLPFLTENFGNPSSVHPAGQAARAAVEKARAQVAALAGAAASEVFFVSGATEANNLAIRGILEPLLRSGKPVGAVTSAIEHPSVSATFASLRARGLDLTEIAAGPDGAVEAPKVLAVIRQETALVSLMAVNNEIGSIQPVAEVAAGLAELAKRPLFHADAVQAAASSKFDFKNSGLDLMSISAHKIGGPKGVGALIVRRGLTPEPMLTGGGQESGLRSGTENVAGIAGFGAASEALSENLAADAQKFASLGRSLLEGLAAGGIRARALLADGTRVVPHILSLECPGLDADLLVLKLGRLGVMVSAGSACHAGSREASRVLKAIGLSEARAKSVIRVSFGRATSGKDVEDFVAAFKRAASR